MARGPIIRFCAQPEVFNLVADYIGQYPVLSFVSLAYTGISDEKNVLSHQFHRDMNDPNQVHIVIPIWPTRTRDPLPFYRLTKPAV